MSFVTSLQLGALLTAWLTASPPGVVTALAERGGTWVVGTDLGLFVREDGVWQRSLTRGGVVDLARAPDALWIATAKGLYIWRENGSAPQPVALGAGARVSSVAVDAAGGVWVASEVGLFRSAPGGSEFEREIAIPPGPVHAVRAAGGQLWIAMRESLWRGVRGSFERQVVSVEEGWWELRGAVEIDGEVWLCVPRGLWRMAKPSPRRIDPGLGEIHALALHSGKLWLASHRGVFRYDPGTIGSSQGRNMLAGPARRLAGARGRAAGRRRARRRASGHGDACGRPSVRGPGRAAARHRARAARGAGVPGDRAGAAFPGCGARPARRLATRVARQGIAGPGPGPGVGLRRGFQLRGGEESVRLEHRQGPRSAPRARSELGSVGDRFPGRRTRDFARAQTAGRIARPSAGAGQRLYFERLRVLAELESAPEERVFELELRASELAAQLDSWTGGRFSRLDDPPEISVPKGKPSCRASARNRYSLSCPRSRAWAR